MRRCRIIAPRAAALLGVCVLLALALPDAAAAAPDDAESPEARYRACMALVDSAPQQARETADAWRKKGGGAPARHCAAAAAFAQGRFADAADMLETLARDDPAAGRRQGDRLLRASIWAQAAHAWLSADEDARAEAAASEAVALAPRNADALLLRARALGAQRRFAEAIADLDRAIDSDPKRADAFVFRAAALRQQGAYPRAMTDLDAALALDPRQPEALLERGIVRRLQGDDAGAKADWQALTEAAPKSPAAEQARLNLEKLDEGE